jgi:HTH-type transcriptional regulator / antitoxin MqsA
MKADTMIHPETGAILRRRRRVETVEYRGLAKRATVSGWFPDGDGDGVLVGADSAPLDKALEALKAKHRAEVGRLARKVRVTAGLSQKDASVLLTGSPNSFYKYEKGAAEPSWPTFLLLKLLDRRPRLIDAIRSA